MATAPELKPEVVAAAAALGVNLPELMASGSIPAGVTPEMVLVALQHRRRMEIQQHHEKLKAASAAADAAKAAPTPTGDTSGGTPAVSSPAVAGAASPAQAAGAKRPNVLLLTPFPTLRGGKDHVREVLSRLGWNLVDERAPGDAGLITDIVVDPAVAANQPFKAALDGLRARLPTVRVLDGCVLIAKLMASQPGGVARAGKRGAEGADGVAAKRQALPSAAAVTRALEPALPKAYENGAMPRGWRATRGGPAWTAAEALRDAGTTAPGAISAGQALTPGRRMAVLSATLDKEGPGSKGSRSGTLQVGDVAEALPAALSVGTPPTVDVPITAVPREGDSGLWDVEAGSGSDGAAAAWAAAQPVAIRLHADDVASPLLEAGRMCCRACGLRREDDGEPWADGCHLACAAVRAAATGRELPGMPPADSVASVSSWWA